MPYPGVPPSKTAKVDSCVKKKMADPKFKPRNKDQTKKQAAIAVCVSSIMGDKGLKKQNNKSVDNLSEEEDKKMSKEKDNMKVFRYFSTSDIDLQKFEKTSDGKTIFKDIDLFKTGTYRQREFTKKEIDLMVANFHNLRSSGTFPRVPFRLDHPGFMSGGSVKDKIGHIVNARREKDRLMVDIEIVDDSALPGIKSGKYIDRSLELGTYEDNEGNVFENTMLGAAFVDIPLVEGLNKKFAFNKNGEEKEYEVEVLNEDDVKDKETMEAVKSKEPEAKKVFNAEEDANEDEEGSEDDKEKTNDEEKTDEKSTEDEDEKSEDNVEGEPAIAGKKKFSQDDEKSEDDGDNKKSDTEPAESGEEAQDGDAESEDESSEDQESQKDLVSERNEWRAKALIQTFKHEGKTVPSMEEAEIELIKSLSNDQLESYKKLKEATPKILELDKEQGEQLSKKPDEKGTALGGNDKNSSERAKDFFERTGGLQGTAFEKEKPKSEDNK